MLTAFMQTTKTVHNASSASSIICLLSFCGVLFANNNMHGGNAERRCSILPTYFKRREKRCVCVCGGGGLKRQTSVFFSPLLHLRQPPEGIR